MWLENYARQLRQVRTIKSENWFRNLWHYYGAYESHDLFNSAWKKYIPDVINHKYKYIIEVDGSIHNLKSVKSKDVVKQRWFEQEGFKVFRIWSNSPGAFFRLIAEVNKRRREIDPNFKNKRKSGF